MTPLLLAHHEAHVGNAIALVALAPAALAVLGAWLHPLIHSSNPAPPADDNQGEETNDGQ